MVLFLAVAAGIFFYSRLGNYPILPEVPTVNLEGADPEISKVVRRAQTLVGKHPRAAPAWGQYAMVLQAHGFSDAAQICYAAAASLEPKNPLWPYLRGYLYNQSPEGPEAALPYFRLAASRSPPDSMAQMRLADTLLETGRLDEAEVEYGKVLAVHENDELAQLGLAKLAVARQQYGEALKYLEPIAESPGARNKVSGMRARAYDRLGDRSAADRERQRLAELPEDAVRADDPALQIFQMAVGVDAELGKARALLDQKQYQETIMALENLVHRYPESYDAWNALGSARGMVNDPVGAERAIRKSLQLSPKNAKGWLNLGNVLLWQERFQESEDPINKSIALNPKSGPAHFALGECRQGLGDPTGAAKAYREAIRLAPNHRQARERLERLGQP
ncbi:MAG: tetratricopeptide repeat protein [Pirellulaceae bacterium]|nr:tetratricopeptide repeat protein [Pirellulaceae bacterium]